MTEVTKTDIDRIHARMDEQGKAITDMAISVRELATTLKLTARHDPPCKALQDHLDEHKQNERDWKVAIIGTIVKYGSAAIVGGAAIKALT